MNVEIQLALGGDYHNVTNIPKKDAQDGTRNLGAMFSREGKESHKLQTHIQQGN